MYHCDNLFDIIWRITMLKDKGGKIIDNNRIMKYEKLCHFMIRKYLPALALFEASMSYDDLLNQCRYEVMMALRNYDPTIAMKSFRVRRVLDENGTPVVLKVRSGGQKIYKTEPDIELRQKEEERKAKDPQTALIKAEESIVYGRLNNYMRRTRWKYSPQVNGGVTVRFGLTHSNLVLPDTTNSYEYDSLSAETAVHNGSEYEEYNN